MSDIRLQEIVTRAVVGRADRRVVWSHAAPAEGADSVLGVHVGNVSVHVEEEDGEAAVRVKATCDLWCGCGADTRVQRLICAHTEPVKVSLNARVVGETETKASLIRGIRCVQADIENGQLNLTLEATVALEVSGNARLWIKTYDLEDETGEDAESGESLGESSSDYSESEISGDYTGDDEGTGDLDAVATLAGSPFDQEAAPAPLLNETLPLRDTKPARRASVISHFQQSSHPSRVSIVQGH